MEIEVKSFDELKIGQLYEILALRNQIFVVELKNAYQDVDGLDFNAVHFLGKKDGRVACYLRLLARENGWRIGRMLTHASYRKQGLSHQLMKAAVDYCKTQEPDKELILSAQHYLVKLYQSMGFKEVSEPYDDEGVDFVDMIYSPLK